MRAGWELPNPGHPLWQVTNRKHPLLQDPHQKASTVVGDQLTDTVTLWQEPYQKASTVAGATGAAAVGVLVAPTLISEAASLAGVAAGSFISSLGSSIGMLYMCLPS